MLQFVNYHHFRDNNPEYFKDVNPLDLGYIGEAEILSVMPYRDQNGRRIMIFRLGKENSPKIGSHSPKVVWQKLS